MENDVILSFRDVVKQFAGVRALKGVSFDLYRGTVHCLVGENGAGKSTLIKILSGAFTIDSGSIWLDGKPIHISGPAAATQLGISVVYQELNVIKHLSIVDNMMLGREHAKYGFNRKQENIKEILPFLQEIDMQVDPNTQLNDLSVAQRQMVMIAKAISLNARIIVLDEPTAMLSSKEVETLFGIIKILKDKGVTVLYISHRMEEVFEIGDRVTVLKDGTHVDTLAIKDTSVDQLIVKMVGRDLTDAFPPKDRKIGDTILEVKNLSNSKLKDISFTLHKGEILGVSGLVGSGRTEMLRAIFGADNRESGTIMLNGKPVSIKNSSDAIKHKIGLVPEDRRNQGVIDRLSVKENITIVFSRLKSRLGFMNKKEDNVVVDRFIRELSIKTPSTSQVVKNLSGGNQQKIVMSKWLCMNPEILLLDEPTQGIDVGAKAEIYQLVDHLARQGMGVIVVSSDLLEILNMSDNIMVMRNGSIVGKLSAKEATEENVITYAMGVAK